MQLTLAELATHIPASIHLFEKYDFNYYQNGKQTFKDACEEKGLSFFDIDKELNQAQKNTTEPFALTLDDMGIDRLIDFINGQYHGNEAQILSLIQSQIQQLLNKSDCEEYLVVLLKEVKQKFSELTEKLIHHCKKEDQILFPYMRKLFDLKRDKSVMSSSQTISLIKNPIRVLEEEHVQAANILSDIKKAANNFTIPSTAPKEYTLLMESLKEFERDLHMHLHIENNILFPKLIALEEELNNRIK